jgi:2-keto-3-deoxy-L-rhamnonate aldolase RhmA
MELNVTKEFKKRLQAGETVYGMQIGPGNEPRETVKALKESGVDFIIVDNEHSLVNKETIYEYMKEAKKNAIPIWLRPEEGIANFRCYLDAGVNGLMCPSITDVEEVAHIIKEAYLPPIGHRGSGIGLSPYLIDLQNTAEIPFLALTEYINDNTMIFPQAENLAAINNLPQIMRLEGVTGAMVGPKDLALDIGNINPKALTADVSTPFMEDKYREIARICKQAGKAAGIGGMAPKDLAVWAKEGYQILVAGYIIDGNVNKGKSLVEELKSLSS